MSRKSTRPGDDARADAGLPREPDGPTVAVLLRGSVTAAFEQTRPPQSGTDVETRPFAALAELLKLAGVIADAYHDAQRYERIVDSGTGQVLYNRHQGIWADIGHLLLQSGMKPVTVVGKEAADAA